MSGHAHDPSCLFCKIVRGEIPSAKVLETDDAVAFLDIQPVNRGHVLLLPKEHHAPPSIRLASLSPLAAHLARTPPWLSRSRPGIDKQRRIQRGSSTTTRLLGRDDRSRPLAHHPPTSSTTRSTGPGPTPSTSAMSSARCGSGSSRAAGAWARRRLIRLKRAGRFRGVAAGSRVGGGGVCQPLIYLGRRCPGDGYRCVKRHLSARPGVWPALVVRMSPGRAPEDRLGSPGPSRSPRRRTLPSIHQDAARLRPGVASRCRFRRRGSRREKRKVNTKSVATSAESRSGLTGIRLFLLHWSAWAFQDASPLIDCQLVSHPDVDPG